ncbi:MAG: hypothetical protein VB138_05835 [Burkholderia sp.]
MLITETDLMLAVAQATGLPKLEALAALRTYAATVPRSPLTAVQALERRNRILGAAHALLEEMDK